MIFNPSYNLAHPEASFLFKLLPRSKRESSYRYLRLIDILIKFCGMILKISGKAITGVFRDHGNEFIILEYLRWTAKFSSYGWGGGENGVKIALLEL